MTDDPNYHLLTSKEAADRCSISVYTFNEKARQGLIPRVGWGGRKGIRYRPEDVDRLIADHLDGD